MMINDPHRYRLPVSVVAAVVGQNGAQNESLNGTLWYLAVKILK